MSQSFFSGMPDFGNISSSVLQSLEMMSQAWGQLGNLSGGAIPNINMSVEELDKRVAELKAVENWLKINLTMLQSTIQGLEVQRSTIATLQAFAQSSKSASDSEAKTDDAMGAAMGAWWDMVQNQFNQIASATAASMAESQAAANNAFTPPPAETTTTDVPKTKPAAKKVAKKKATAAKKTGSTKSQTDLKL